MSLSLILDIIVAILLVITIAYAIVLNKRLSALRHDKAELEKMALSFGDATSRAQESISKLKGTTDGLHDGVSKAQALRDDLAFLIDRGGSAADRLEESIRAARDQAGVGPRPSVGRTDIGNGNDVSNTKSQAERELLKALRAAR